MAVADDAAILARIFRKLLTVQDAERAQAIDHATGGGSRILLERATGLIDESQVTVSHPTFSPATGLGPLLDQIIAAIAAIAIPAVAVKNYVYVIDPDDGYTVLWPSFDGELTWVED